MIKLHKSIWIYYSGKFIAPEQEPAFQKGKKLD